jgi:uncharacterized membrane protein YphA (DoxX/SURF4 family)
MVQSVIVANSGGVDAPGKHVWRPGTRIAFRFAFVYLILSSILPLSIVSPALLRTRWFFVRWREVSAVPALWLATHVFGVTDFDPNFLAADSVAGWAGVALQLIIAAVAAVIWSMIDRRPSDHRELHQWLRAAVRIVAGLMFLEYGAQKVWPAQMPLLRPHQLLGTLGSYEPAQLLWAFMGASRGYQAFTGFVELTAGALLLLPRSTTVGALIGVAASANIVALDVFFDVQVKLGALHLLIMCVFLLQPALRRLADALVLNHAVPPADDASTAAVRFAWAPALQVLVACGLVVNYLVFWRTASQNVNVFDTTRVPHYGIWNVEEFSLDGVQLQPLVTDDVRWHRVVFDDYYNTAYVQRMNGALLRTRYVNDERQKKLSFAYGGDRRAELHEIFGPKWTADFTVSDESANLLKMRGVYNGRPAALTLRRTETRFPLTSHERQWVVRRPYGGIY